MASRADLVVPHARESMFVNQSHYSAKNLLELLQQQDREKGDQLAQTQKNLYDLKRNIALASKKNFTLERDIRNLDSKIALLIRNRISLEEVIAQSGDISLINRTTTLKDKKARKTYGKLFYLLQTDTRYIAQLASLVKLGEIDNLLQTVMFTLYGNQYDEYEEHLLLSMFQQVITYEFENAKGLSGVLRANTAITRMMTTYTRRSPGQHYLKQVITPVLKQITDNTELNLEVNPLKVYEEMINQYETQTGKISELDRKASQEEAAANEGVKQTIGERIAKLGEITDLFISALINSMQTVPYGIRWICKQIRSLVKTHFPESTREQHCSMIGGFFLLRFINPAIVTPQAFMLVDSKLSPRTRRNLTLMAKIMQNLANNVRFGGVKEFFMEPLNVALDRNRQRLNDFLEQMTHVDDLQDHLSMDRYIALGRTQTPTINISLNEMYFIHALMKTHASSLLPNTPEHAIMREVMQELGTAPAQLPRKENANVDLELDKTVKGTEDTSSYSADQIYTESKYLLFMVMKALPQVRNGVPASITIDQVLEQATGFAKARGDNNLYESVERVKENIKLLVREGIISSADDYATLRKDAAAELMNQNELIEKTGADLARLKEVLGNIQDHHAFLQEQFDAYKEYLDNVRSKSNCVDLKKKKKEEKAERKAKKKEGKSSKAKGPFKYSHTQLEKDGIIMSSEVPEDRHSSIFFVFSASTPGVFDVVVMFGRRHIARLQLQLDDLLERQHLGQLEYETDFLKLNVNLLIYLLNRDFVS